MCERRSLPYSRVLESYGLDPAPENGVLLLQAIERGAQLHDNCVALISDDDQFEVDLFVYHLNAPISNVMPDQLQTTPGSRITGNDLGGKGGKD